MRQWTGMRRIAWLSEVSGERVRRSSRLRCERPSAGLAVKHVGGRLESIVVFDQKGDRALHVFFHAARFESRIAGERGLEQRNRPPALAITPGPDRGTFQPFH